MSLKDIKKLKQLGIIEDENNLKKSNIKMRKQYLLLKETPVNLLLTLAKYEEVHLSKLIRDAGLAYSHAYYVIKELEKLKVIESKKVDNTKQIKLTKKGIDLVHYLNEIILLTGE